jgi:hypothetical protein
VLGGAYPQNVRLVHRVTDVCGSVTLTTKFSNGSIIRNQTDIVLAGLQPIPTSTNLRLKVPSQQHPSPYWGTGSFIAKLVLLANGYAAKTGKPIVITDGSLATGGRFDLNKDWRPPHHEHMGGGEAEIRSNDMSDSDKKIFLSVASSAGLQVLVESSHWHVRG